MMQMFVIFFFKVFMYFIIFQPRMFWNLNKKHQSFARRIFRSPWKSKTRNWTPVRKLGSQKISTAYDFGEIDPGVWPAISFFVFVYISSIVCLLLFLQERFQLRDKAAELSEKHEDLRDTQDNLMLRIEAVLNSIQRRLPVASDSEIRMQRQLQGMERKMKDLVNGKINIFLFSNLQWVR